MRVLVVEDNHKMGAAIQRGLTEHGFQVDLAQLGQEGEELALTGDYAAIVLDVMLPDHDGILICRNLRTCGVKAPVLLLTALSETADKVRGLNSGADDFLSKPFDFEELVARLRALLRRSSDTESSVLRYQDIELDLLRREVTRAGRPVRLTSKEFSLLELFLRKSDKVLSRLEIGQQVWDMNFDAASNVIDVYISMLRRKIDKPFDRPYIHTVVGSGYMFSASVPCN